MEGKYFALTVKITGAKDDNLKYEKLILEKNKEKFLAAGALKPPKLLRGGVDEVQTVMPKDFTEEEIESYYTLISTIFGKYKIYMGVGFGEIHNSRDYVDNAETTWEMDGTCFWGARAAVDEAILNDKNYVIKYSYDNKTNTDDLNNKRTRRLSNGLQM